MPLSSPGALKSTHCPTHTSDTNMATVLDLHFNSDVEGFSAGTWTNSAGSALIDGAAGALQVGAGVTAAKDFTNITSGTSRVDLWLKSTGTSTPASNGTTLIYLLANGATVASATSICTIGLDRSINAAYFQPTYRNNSGTFTNWPGTTGMLRVDSYFKVSFVVNHTAKTVDLYFGDVLWIRAIPWVDTSVAGLGRIAVVGQSSAENTWIDDILVTSDWTAGESVLVDHTFVGGSGEIEASTPTTASRGAAAQPWKIADDTATYGAFTLGANGAAPDASKKCLALQRVCQDGIIEIEFRTSVAGTTYIGMQFRFWDYPTASLGGGGAFRISGTNWNLYLPDRTGTLQIVQTGTIAALSANTTYTLKLECRGRYYICSYKAAALTAGSYTELVAHAATSSATGGRGMLIEELAGPFIDTGVGATDNYVRRFRFTGAIPATDVSKTIGSYTWEVNSGSIKSFLSTGSAAPTRNLFWSRGIQYGHRSSADSVGAPQSAGIYDSANVYAVHQTAQNITEYEWLGYTDLYVTLLRRGPWVSDHIYAGAVTENFAPDMDLRPELWSKSFLTINASGAASSQSDATLHDWTVYGGSGALPKGNQSLTAYGSGNEVALSQIVLPVTNAGGSVWGLTSKYEGNGDPISRACSVDPVSLSAGTNYRVARAFLARTATVLDSTLLGALRDDLATPASIVTFTTGSLKTNAGGDGNTDGFNERHGWYEINCSGGVCNFTFPVASGTRFYPAFRLSSWTNTNTGLKINGSYAVPDTDYVIDDLGGGVGLLQLLSDRTANTTIEVTVPNPNATAYVPDVVRPPARFGVQSYGFRR